MKPQQQKHSKHVKTVLEANANEIRRQTQKKNRIQKQLREYRSTHSHRCENTKGRNETTRKDETPLQSH